MKFHPPDKLFHLTIRKTGKIISRSSYGMFLAGFVVQGVNLLERLAEYRALVDCAKKAALAAYAPYSKTAQGAALLSQDGKMYFGAKMECAAYGAAVCAEAAALTAAISAGVRKFQAIAIHPSEYPCGASRQMLAEFGINLDVVVEGSDGQIQVINLKDLLPSHFGPDNLS